MEASHYLLAADLAEENGDDAKQKECQGKAGEAKRLNDELNKLVDVLNEDEGETGAGAGAGAGASVSAAAAAAEVVD